MYSQSRGNICTPKNLNIFLSIMTAIYIHFFKGKVQCTDFTLFLSGLYEHVQMAAELVRHTEIRIWYSAGTLTC